MSNGILILGLNGCGKTTVCRALADRLHSFAMDAEDYYFPVPGDFSQSRTEEEARRLMEEDVLKHGNFVLSCVKCNLSEKLLTRVRLAVVLRTSPDIRAERIRQRGIDRFGARSLPGGDLYEQQQAFRAFAAARTEDVVYQSLKSLTCPILEADAALPVDGIVEQICQCIQKQDA